MKFFIIYKNLSQKLNVPDQVKSLKAALVM